MNKFCLTLTFTLFKKDVLFEELHKVIIDVEYSKASENVSKAPSFSVLQLKPTFGFVTNLERETYSNFQLPLDINFVLSPCNTILAPFLRYLIKIVFFSANP